MKKSEYEHLYQPAQRFIIYHDEDEDLDTIKINLPEPPPHKEMINYGLPPEAQYFKRTVRPPKLDKLDKESFENPEEYWTEVENHIEYYEDELPFIEQEWERFAQGVWILINGRPYYFPGWFYQYLNYWRMDSETGDGYAEFRDRDRKKYIFFYAMFIDPTVFGVVYVKHRRDGATTNAQQINYFILTSSAPIEGQLVKTGIQSKTEKDAADVFSDKFMVGVRGMPFYFRPIIRDMDNQTKVEFKMPKSSPLKNSKTGKKKRVLNSVANYKSSTPEAYDGIKLRYSHQDEVGKTVEADVAKRWNVIKQCHSLGANKKIIGFCLMTSTIGEMEKGGGQVLAKISRASHYGRRNKTTGQTTSGLVNLFIPADEGLEGFIDEYGFSKKAEARAWIMAQRKDKEDQQDWDGLSEVIRQSPLNFKEAFFSNNSRARFNMIIINRKKTEWEINGPSANLRYGRFEYAGSDGKWKSHGYKDEFLPKPIDIAEGRAYVRFVETSKENACWEVSFLFENPALANRIKYNAEKKRHEPGNNHLFSHGVDMYRARGKTTSGKASNGAGAVYRKFDASVDNPADENRKNQFDKQKGDYIWVTDRFCAIYNHKPPTKEEFCEQQLMAAIYYGMKTYPEMNITTVSDHYFRRGFEGYLFFEYDEKKDEEKFDPGKTTTDAVKDDIWNELADHLEQNGLREHHPTLFDQCEEIDTDMGDYDVFAACGYAKIAARIRISQYTGEDKIDLNSGINEYYD